MLPDRIRAFLARHDIGPCRIVAACSGGVDSTALLIASAEMKADGYEIVCAHINHHLRGDESNGDEMFVRELCRKLEIDIEVRDGSLTGDAIRHSGIEGAARDVRIALLQEIRGGSGFIATAHQKNDQAETIVMRMITGTGVAGLRGIHPLRDDGIIRPLLETTREEIVSFLEQRGVTPRIDRTNADTRFLRNKVRLALHDFGTDAIDNIASVADQARQMWPRIENIVDAAERAHVHVSTAETRFHSWPADPWLRQALLQRHIRRLDANSREISARDLARLIETMDAIERVSVTKSVELIRREGALVLRHKPGPTNAFEIKLHAGETAFIDEINATIHVEHPPATENHQRFQLPDDAPATFTVRNRRPGDRFRPLGMHSDKKLKDFLIDRKIPVELRDRIPLLVWNGEIVWVGGVEISDRFKVTSPAGELFEVVLAHESRQHQDSVQR